MKKSKILIAGTAACLLLLAGCGNSDSPTVVQPGPVPTVTVTATPPVMLPPHDCYTVYVKAKNGEGALAGPLSICKSQTIEIPEVTGPEPGFCYGFDGSVGKPEKVLTGDKIGSGNFEFACQADGSWKVVASSNG